MDKKVFIFAGGVVIGAAAGILGSMKFFQKKYSAYADKVIADMEEYFNRTDEYARTSFNDATVNPVSEDMDINPRELGVLAGTDRAEMKKRTKDYISTPTEEKVNYAAMYKGHSTENTAEENSDDQLTEESEEELESDAAADEEPAEEMVTIEHKKNSNRKPKIISASDAAALPEHIEQETLYFYMYDDVLTDEDENDIADPEYLVGDALTKYGFSENDEKIIYVRNYALDTVYEIQKRYETWSDTH